jgi:hypothetical protein
MGGKELAAVRALAGKPFVGGDRWPVRTEYSTVEVNSLAPVARLLHVQEVAA